MLTLKQIYELLDSIPDPIFILTETGRYVEVFGGKDPQHHHDASQLIGLSVKDVLSTKKANWFISKINQALKSKELLITEYSLSEEDINRSAHNCPFCGLYFEAHIHYLNFCIKGESVVLWQTNNITQRYQLEEKLRTISETDPLTGVWNRRYFYQAIYQEQKRASRSNTPVSLLMLDIDHFKIINDHWGHKVGDLILMETVLVMIDSIRESDMIIRWGGEEFIVIMPNTALNSASYVAEKLRMRIAHNKFVDAINVQVSIGYAQWDFTNEKIDKTVEKIDTALYVAKNEGRNCVKCYHELITKK